MKQGVSIEPYALNQEVITWSDAAIITNSTLVNNTIDNIIEWSKGKSFSFMVLPFLQLRMNLMRLCFEAE